MRRQKEITQAARAVASKQGKARTPTNPTEEALREALGARAATKAVRVTVRGGVVTFSGVKVESLAAFAKVLTGVKLPSDKPAARAAGKRTAQS